MAGFRIEGDLSGNTQEVDITKNARVNLPGYNASGIAVGGGDGNAPAMFSEIDNGATLGTRTVVSPKTDTDGRLRVAHDTLLAAHSFCADSAQNTSLFSHLFSVLTATQSTAGLLTNSAGITTLTTGMTFGTHAMFLVGGTQTAVFEQSIAFPAQPTANLIFDFGPFQRGVTPAFAPLDGAYFRINSGGLFGVVNNNGIEVVVGPFPATGAGGLGTFTYANNAVNRYSVQLNNVATTFWINGALYASVPTPTGNSFPCMSRTLPWSVRHAVVGGTAGASFQALIKDHRVFTRGVVIADSLSEIQARVNGSMQGLTAATIGSLGTYTNSTNPVAAVPLNASLAVGSVGLLNQAWETFSLAVNTDAIIQSYQVPAGTPTSPGRRMKIVGVKLSSFIQTVLVGGPCNRVFALNFGGTGANLATAESASFTNITAKARRVVLLPELTQTIAAAQAVNTAVSQLGGSVSLMIEPIYVNPGEFISVSEKIIGTVGTSGTIVNHIQVIAVPE